MIAIHLRVVFFFNDTATTEIYTLSLHDALPILLQLQQRNAELVQGWTSDVIEALSEQTEQNVRTAEAFAQLISKQQEGLRILTQGWSGAYRDFFSPFAYAREGLRSVQRATRQGLEATEQVARQDRKSVV